MKHLLKQFGIVFILLSINTGMALANDGYIQPETIWFSTDTSGLLNRSSMALAGNHVNRGIRFAHKATQKLLSPTDKLIASHNLCVGYLSNDKTELATPYCARTVELSQGTFNITRTRGAYRLSTIDVNNEPQTTPSLLQVVLNNIQQQNSQIQLSLLIK